MPAGFVAGDLLVAIVHGSNSTAPTSPGGWTLLRNTSDAVFHQQIMWKQAAGGDTGTWTVATARKWAGACVAVTVGTWLTGTPWSVENAIAQGTTAGTSYATPTVTIGHANTLALSAFGNAGASTFTSADTSPAMTEIADSTSTGTAPASIAVYRSNTSPAVAALTRSATATVSSADGVFWVGAVREALVATAPPLVMAPRT
jgi:hypothetical protein